MKVVLLTCLLCVSTTLAGDLAQLNRSAQCDGTICPSGCCPEPDWFCCPNTQYCASKPENCPPGEIMLMAMTKEKKCEGSLCPGWGPDECCNDPDYTYCCPDGPFCAPTAQDCP